MTRYPAYELTAGIADDLLAASEVWHTPRRNPARRILPVAAVLAALVLLIAGLLIANRGGRPTEQPPEGSSSAPVSPYGPQISPDFRIENGVLLAYIGDEETVCLPEGITVLSANAFSGNSTVRTLYLSSTLEKIEEGCLTSIPTLTEVHPATTGNYTEESGLVISDTTVCYANRSLIGSRLVIPEGITAIHASLFLACYGLEEVILPSTMESIGQYAFANITTLYRASLGGTLRIGNSAFRGCSSLTEVDFGVRLTEIGEYAFSGCAMTSVTLPASLENLRPSAFRNTSLRTIIYAGMPYQWERLFNAHELWELDMFEICFLTENPTINPPVYHSLGDGTCRVSASGTFLDSGDVVIPEYSPDGDLVTTVDGYANCPDLRSITLPASVTRIADGAFDGCTGLISVMAPGVTEIGEGCFRGCSSLTAFRVPSGVVSIGDSAFEDCSALESVVLPDGLTDLGVRAFRGCAALAEIVLPDGIQHIGGEAFSQCCSIRWIDLATTGITELSYGVFSFCDSLEEIALPSGLRTIASSAFRGCDSLLSVDLTETLVTTIGASAFHGCASLTGIALPGSLDTLGFDAFGCCASLQSIDLRATGVTILRDSTFQYCRLLSKVLLPANLSAISAGVFSGCASLEEIDLPAELTILNDRSFKGCSSLASIVLPDGLTYLGSEAFADCSSLRSITLPAAITRISQGLFSGCSSLCEITSVALLVRVGENAFAGCTAEKRFYYPANESVREQLVEIPPSEQNSPEYQFEWIYGWSDDDYPEGYAADATWVRVGIGTQSTDERLPDFSPVSGPTEWNCVSWTRCIRVAAGEADCFVVDPGTGRIWRVDNAKIFSQ